MGYSQSALETVYESTILVLAGHHQVLSLRIDITLWISATSGLSSHSVIYFIPRQLDNASLGARPCPRYHRHSVYFDYSLSTILWGHDYGSVLPIADIDCLVGTSSHLLLPGQEAICDHLLDDLRSCPFANYIALPSRLHVDSPLVD